MKSTGIRSDIESHGNVHVQNTDNDVITIEMAKTNVTSDNSGVSGDLQGLCT